MGRGPHWHPPRHLAAVRRSRTDAREHLVAEWLLAAVAIVLTTVVLVSQMLGHGDRSGPGPAPTAGPAPPATARPPAAAPSGAAPPLSSPAPAGWRAIGGARVERAAAGPGQAQAGFTASGLADQGVAVATPRRCVPGRTYAATVRLRASRPATLVTVTLLEVAGGRRGASDTAGAVLHGGWQAVEVVHEGQRPGAGLAVEVVIPRGSPPATVQVAGLEVTGRPTGHP
jgi:hypothetical protein